MKKTIFILWRVLLGCLILANMALIFGFSGENAAQSAQTSNTFTETVVEITVPDFDKKPEAEQKEIIQTAEPIVRKMAHFSEYASLGGLIFLLLLSWKGAVVLKLEGAVGFSMLYAATDELHQKFSFGRAASALDLTIDTSGALFACLLLLLIWLWVQRHKKIRTTVYTLPAQKLARPVRLAVLADLHGKLNPALPEMLRAAEPDAILIPGDLTGFEKVAKGDTAAYDFLSTCASIAPTYYSLGNHETGASRHNNPLAKPCKKALPPAFFEAVKQTGATLLQNDCVLRDGIWFCGLESGFDGEKNRPDAAALERFCACPGYRIVLCHHPEYFIPYLRETDLDLVICGHAHGGHWRFFGHGIYAPDQGIFPKYTAGVLDGRCVISRGLGDHTVVPRLNNPHELVLIDLQPTE